MIESSPAKKDLRVLMDEQLDISWQHTLAAQKINRILGCIKEVCPVVKGDDSAPLFCSGEISHGVLHPAVEPSAQERHGPVGVGPEEGHKNDQGARTPVLCIKAERVGVFQPGEVKAPGRPYCGLSALKAGL